MKLNEIKPAKGAVRKAWRRGQGPGSGNGKTAGRGHKGQWSRSGTSMRAGFEGGQMPLSRRVPKRGFHNPFRKEYSIVNLDAIERLFPQGGELGLEQAREHGLLRPNTAGLKLLGGGEIKHAVVVHVHKASAQAKQKIEQAGGRVEIVAPAAGATQKA